MDDDDDPGDVPNEVTPPFDAFDHFLPTEDDIFRVDSSVADPLRGLVSRRVIEDLDAYYKAVWMKHHG